MMLLTNMAEEKEKKEEEKKEEILKPKSLSEIVIPSGQKIKTSNLEDDLDILLTSAEKTDLTDGGNCSAHKHDDRYYTETELDNGQLDTRYYTKTQLDGGQLDTRYYTETELDNGQLDSIYLNKSNTTAYTPTADYHPATKKYVDDNVGGTKIYVAYSDVDVTNTDLETEILNCTIPGGTLGTNNAIKARLYLYIYRASAYTFSLKAYYGTGYVGVSSIEPTANTDFCGYLDILLVGAGATNAQEMSFMGIFPRIYSGDTANSGESIFYIVTGSGGSLSIDSTADQTFKVTVDWSGANSGDHVKLLHAVVEKVT